MPRIRIDEEHVAAACTRHFSSDTTIANLRRLSGGASRETWSFDAIGADGAPQELVLRRDPGSSIGGTDRSTEFHLLRAAHSAGVPVPEVRFLLSEADGMGAGFVMERIAGETIPRKILRDDQYERARDLLTSQCGKIAAQIHAMSLDDLPALPVQDALTQINQYRAVLDGFGEPHPAFELGLRWLEERAPTNAKEPQLVHGDFRNGNFIVGENGIRSVLDWELAHLGDPIEDLGWLCVKSWRFGNSNLPVGGFGMAKELLDTYAATSGTEVDEERLRYWEVFGTLKWGVICELQGFTHLNGLVRSVELAALGRRVAEMEWDLLELLDA
ncbi:MAG: phosphotransferase family protein [Acidimicrobiia bacterium]|nr:phosphotransferase family protein [Acidimicrobiia bacterium]